MRNYSTARVLFVTFTAATLLLGSAEALAGGFAAARFGGELGNPTESGPVSLYYNPGAIALGGGTKLTLDTSFVWRTASVDRAVEAVSEDTDEARAVNAGEGTVDNFIVSPMFGVTTNFGVDTGLVAGFAFYAPFGGQAVWDTKDGLEAYPGSEDGPQRWYTIDGTIRTLAYTFGLGYEVKDLNLSFGLTGSLLQSTVSTIRARNADGSDNIGGGEFQTEGRSFVDVSSVDYNVGAGVLWEVLPDFLWVGASYTSAPNFTGDMEFEGKLRNILGVGNPTEEDIIFTSSLPDIVRLGVRLKPIDALQLRAFGDYTRWSVLEQQCIIGADATNIEEACATAAEDGSPVNAEASNAVIQVLQRRWQDTFGLRLNASYELSDGLEVYLGGGFDSNAIPDEYLEPALFDMNKYTASLGVRYTLFGLASVMLTATNVFYAERDTTGVNTAESLSPPSTQPGSQGVYKQNIALLNANLEVGF